jgi:hypothetical protein
MCGQDCSEQTTSEAENCCDCAAKGQEECGVWRVIACK